MGKDKKEAEEHHYEGNGRISGAAGKAVTNGTLGAGIGTVAGAIIGQVALGWSYR